MTGNNHGKKSISSAKRVLLFIVGIVVALAVAVTCALFYNNEAQRVNVNEVENTPTTSRALSNTTGDQTATGALVAGDVITYTYSGGVRSITLPAGTYTLRANGAQGGVSPHCTTANNTGGSAWGTFEITSNTTLYIAVGGKGADGSSGYLGGWNGGGHGGHKGTDTAGGGGATHIARTNNRGELRNYNSYRSEVLVVGGGGGGNGCSSWVGGQGGGSAGTAGAGGSSYAPGGVQGTATAAGATRGNGTAPGFGTWSP